MAQLGRMDEVDNLASAFKARYPRFVPQGFMRDHPITAPGAQRLFLDGSGKAGLGQASPHGPASVVQKGPASR